MARQSPPKAHPGPLAAFIDGGWRSYPTTYEARDAAWAQPERPTVWRLGPSGWAELAPGPPKSSGARGYGGGRPRIQVRCDQEELDEWERRAKSSGLSLQDWARRALRRAK